MKFFPYRSLVVVFWLGIMGWFIRYEAYPALFTHTVDGYRAMLDGGPLFMDSWMRILLKNHPIGFSHSQIEVNDESVAERYKVSNKTAFEFSMMGEPQYVQVNSEASLDERYQLQRLEFTMNSRRYEIDVEGTRGEGNEFNVSIKSPAGTEKMRVSIPDDVVIYSPLTEMAMRKLRPGDYLRIKTLDPASMSTADVLVKALRRETIHVAGKDEASTVLSMLYQGMEMTTWLSTDGRVLRQDTPYSWTLEACSARDALASDRSAALEADLLTAMAVPVRGTIRDPESCRELHLRFHGLRLDPGPVSTGRQRVESMSSNTVDLVLVTAAPGADATTPTNLAHYLASSPFVQSDDARMRKKAGQIVGTLTDPAEKARAIYQWVFDHVEKNSAATLPSALDVLTRLEGDCNEHTYLYVGLARAAGIPAQIRVGLVYKDGHFYYHAWPAAYVGYWMEMDPTWGQVTVDVTHVALLEGELGNQLPLLGTLGRVEAEVVSEVY